MHDYESTLFLMILDMMIMHDYEGKLFLMILDMMIMMIMQENFSSWSWT